MISRTYPAARIAHATDAAAFAERILEEQFDVAIVAADPRWADGEHILRLIKQRFPDTALILFGDEAALAERALRPGVVVEGLAAKNSAGFIALPELVGEVLERRQRDVVPAAFLTSIEDIPVPALAADRAGHVLQLNDAMRRLLDMEDSGGPHALLQDLLSDDSAREAWRRLRSEPVRPGATAVLAITAADGANVTLSMREFAGTDHGACFLGCAEAIETPRRASPVRHPGGTDVSGQELRDIAMVFSHDIKEPVQLIERLCRRLAERSEFGPGNPASKWVAQIMQCSERTSEMLDSMLEYLAVSARDASPGLVDLNNCLEQALENLRAAIDEANAEITADHLPSVTGDEYQMLHLFQNLISNALKFRGRDRLMLRITVEPDGQQWRIAFTDNGIGIPEPYFGRVFEMGQRLHTHDEYPGTGVGLAICRRIVERHGGRIWVRANDGSGCTFFVELPQTPSHVTRLA